MPAGFWGDDDAEPQPMVTGGPGQTQTRPGGTAFAELQELFPGRIIEVLKDRPAAGPEAASGDDATAPDDTAGDPSDEAGAEGEGYDDPDQAQLSFGPSE